MKPSSSTFTGKEEKPVYSEQRLSRLGHAALALQNVTPLAGVPSTHEIDQLLQGVVDTFYTELNYPNCQIFVVNQSGSELEFKYGRGHLVEQARRDDQNQGWRPRLGEDGLQGKEGLVGWVGSALKPVNLPDVQAGVGFAKPFQEVAVRSELTVPMLAQNELIGVIDIQSEETHAFDNLDLEIVNFFARQAAAMIQAATLSRLMAESLRNLSLVASSVSKANGARTFSETGELVLTNAVRALNAQSGSIWLVNESGPDHLQGQSQPLQLLTTLNLPDWFNDDNLNFSPVILNILNNGMPVFISALEKYQEGLETMVRLRTGGIEAFCCLPLYAHGQTLGALVVSYKEQHKFSKTEVQLSTVLAEQAAAAFLNLRNLSHIKRLEQQLVRSEQLGALGQLASGIAHDFNNVLGGSLGVSEILLDKTDDPDDRHLLEMLRQSIQDGAQMVRRLQSLGSGKSEDSLGPVEIGRVLQDVIELTRPRWSGEAGRDPIEINFEADPLPPCRGNATELREVFTNLILNAVDAMPQGGRIDILIQDHREREEIWISVRDNGTGMTEATKRRLFEPFYTTKANDGHGLGLSISKSIIERHEGTIEVESDLNKGSCFQIKLPFKPEDRPATPRKITAPVRPLRVLVIDDDLKLLYILKRILEIDRHEVTVTGSGREAVRLFTTQPDNYDLVLTDINLKDLNGWQIAQAVRLLRPEVPIIVVTGGAVNLQPEKIKHYAITEVLAKPYSLEDLQKAIRKLADFQEHKSVEG
jgi:signal transduction histidine kinase/CheY-like chemotaxis protein